MKFSHVPHGHGSFRPALLRQSAKPDLLVDTAWVAAHRVRSRRARRRHAHARVRRGSHSRRRAPLERRDPRPEPAAAPFSRRWRSSSGSWLDHGISNTTRVVVYDDRGGIYAARLWYVLNVFGHSNVALLDGGWTKWTSEARPTVGGAHGHQTRIVQGHAQREDGRDRRRRRRRHRQEGREDPGRADGRRDRRHGPARHQARRRRALVGAALLGRRPQPAGTDLQVAGRDREAVRRRAASAASDDVIIYCQVGMRASHDAFTLALIGRTKVRVYYGSWEEWGNRDDLPIKKH